jgi:peptidoglycan/LPS O-acetylase OafA/YrhL
LDAGRFSIVTFYERRVRRIFPAMLVMMAVTTIFVYRFFVPLEVEGYGRSLLAALFSCSNFLLWHEAGYFDTSSAVKPLLHTWSLAVEEQFYILFPIFLVLVRRFFPKRLKEAVLSLGIVSLVAAVFTVRHDATAAFYFAPLRAWELLIGTVISQHYVPAIRNAALRNLASGFGLLLILVPAVAYNSTTVFPGLTAVPPCVGAALIIAAGEFGPSVVGRLLSMRPVVFIGLISYSLYLWHWPIVVLQNTNSILFSGVIESTKSKILVVAISIVIATLSWAFVEQPFRKGRFRPGRRAVFVVNGLALSAIALVAVSMIWSKGFPSRFPLDAQKIASYSGRTADEAVFREEDCFVGDQNTYSDYKPQICLAQSSGKPAKPSILLIGDSHALQLYPGLAAVFPQFDILQATAAGCVPPLKTDSKSPSDCEKLGNFIYQDFLAHHHVDLVLLAGRWRVEQFDEIQAIIDFVHAHGSQVAIVGPNIEYDVPLPRLLATSIRDNKLDRVHAHRNALPQEVDQRMATQALTVWHVPYISIYDDLCTPNCPVLAAEAVPLLLDTDHFTSEGSIRFAEAMRDKSQLQPTVSETSRN